MKKFLNLFMLLSLFAGWSSCSDNDDPVVSTTDEVDATQQEILKNYVNKVVVPTYRSLADAAALLAEDCENLTSQAAVNKACADWVEARKYWELSEAFLFGAAADYNIDPHIDSWPLDLTQLDEVLKAGNIEERIEAGTAGYGLLGFHAVEYVIFKEGSTGDANSRQRDVATISEVEARFAAVVAADMSEQCDRLVEAWEGVYGETLYNAGLPGNAKYKTQSAAFEEILIGASDIANEVANTKISDPMASHQWSDVESPHSWNSVADFIDNIRSVRNAYFGSIDGTISTTSVSALVASKDKGADEKVRQAINEAIQKLEAIPRPFRNYISETSGENYNKIQAAIDACNDLVDTIDEIDFS